MVESTSPKRVVAGSSPVSPVIQKFLSDKAQGLFFYKMMCIQNPQKPMI